MNIDEAISQLDGLIGAFDKEMRNLSEELALDTMALIINRIQQQGLPGKTYSKRKMKASTFDDKDLNAGGRSLLERRKKSGEGISYEEWREANGLQAEFVDLTFTGRMWQNTGIIGTTINGNNYITIIGGFDKEVKDKLRWNAQRYGDFFVLTEQEKIQLQVIYKKKLDTIIKKYIA